MTNKSDPTPVGVGSREALYETEVGEFYGRVALGLEALDELWNSVDALPEQLRRWVVEARKKLLQVDPTRPEDHEQHRLLVGYAFFCARKAILFSHLMMPRALDLTRFATLQLGCALDAVHLDEMSSATNGGVGDACQS